MLAGAGDAGVSNPDGPEDNAKNYPFPTVNFPASSPYVTAVGGTSLHTKDDSTYLNETVWNHNTGASGSGVSQYFGETSAGTPEWAGLIADGNQMAKHSLGFINPAIYNLSTNKENYTRAFHDITIGDTSLNGIPGYAAHQGWDLASGFGTPNDTSYLLKEIAAYK